MSESRLKLMPQNQNLLFRSKGGSKEKIASRATLTQAILHLQTNLSTSVKLTSKVPAKLDSCAIVNLSNSKYCTNIRPCQEYDLPPIQLSGIGGSTDPIRKAGLLTVIVKGRKKTAHAYILDKEVAGNKAICLIGLRTLIKWNVDLNFHMRESYQGECSPLRLNAVHEKRSKIATRLKKSARSNWFMAVHKNNPATCNKPSIASTKRAQNLRQKRDDLKTRLLNCMSEKADCPTLGKSRYVDTGEEVALVTDSRRAPHYPNARKKPKLKPKRTSAKKQGSKLRSNFPEGATKTDIKNIINRLLKKGIIEPHQGAYNSRPPENPFLDPFVSPQCSKGSNHDHSCGENFCCTCSPTFVYAETPEEHEVLMSEFSCDETEAILMSEIQIRTILDRVQASKADQGTDGAATMEQAGQTISKFSREAMVLGDQVGPEMMRKIHAVYDAHVGQDKVFPTKNGPPKILTMYKDKPYEYELRNEFKSGSLQLPTVRSFDWDGKPATSKIIRDFIASTPVVSPCAHPRCISRLVIVPKLDPGQSKESLEHGFRVTVNALFNKCLKPAASTIPLATSEIKKLHNKKFFAQIDGLSAFWSIPVGEESKRLTAFHTPDGVYCWDRLLMGARPSSSVQQSAYLRALDDYADKIYHECFPEEKDRHGLGPSIRSCYASYCDDLACGAETLDQLFILFFVLIGVCAKAGIQVKASKCKFGVEEITFHNYLINSTSTRPKQANLCPIRNFGIPRDVHQVKSFLGMAQQLSQYIDLYSIIAQPLHALTKGDGSKFPKPWIAGSPYDLAFHRLKAALLDPDRFLWHKDKSKRLFIECDASDLGFGAAAYQYATTINEVGEEEGVARLKDVSYKRVIEWMSKAWSTDQLKLPVFYRESLARLIVLEKFRNLIESNYRQGTTVYTDHLPALFKSSLSNKGQLSEWRINEVQDLNSIVQTLYKKGPLLVLSDALSRCCQPETDLYDNDMPRKIAVLLDRLPERIKHCKYIRVHYNKDTAAAGRIVQRWRSPKNPVSPVAPASTSIVDFVIAFPLDKGTITIKDMLLRKQPFAMLIPVSTICKISQCPATRAIIPHVQAMVDACPKIIISAANLAWIMYFGKDEHCVQTQVLINVDDPNSEDFGCGHEEAVEIMDACVAQCVCLPMTRSQAKAEASQSIDDGISSQAATFEIKPKRKGRAKRKTVSKSSSSCVLGEPEPKRPKNGTATSRLMTSYKDAPPDTHENWVGQQLKGQPIPESQAKKFIPEIPNLTLKLCGLLGDHGQARIIVPLAQQKRVIMQAHHDLLHQGHNRVYHELRRAYYWPNMQKTIEFFVTKCTSCQESKMRRQHLKTAFHDRELSDLPLPRQSYGFDFYGVPKGEILVIVDHCTRETILVFMTTRDMKKVATALLNKIIFIRGVPLTLRSDSAPELVAGIVMEINSYLNITHLRTGGHNPRGNSICERVNQTIGAMLRKCSDKQYANIKDYLPCMAFAINCTYSSALNCTPFEAGHGLPARTIAQARASSARLQFRPGGNDDTVQDVSKRFDSGLQKEILELATRMALAAQQESEHQRRMTNDRLNAMGKKISTKAFEPKSLVYFYKPPTQAQALATGRKVKHLAHYCGPATVLNHLGRNAYKLAFEGKTFQRDAGMIFPYCPMPEDLSWEEEAPKQKPSFHKATISPWEGEFIITKGDADAGTWWVAQIYEVLTDRVKVKTYTTISPPLEDYASTTITARTQRLEETTFLQTWCLDLGRGKATTIPPQASRRDKDVWTWKIPKSEFDQHFLVRNVTLSALGVLDPKSISLAAQLDIPHQRGAGDERYDAEQL